MMTPPAEVYRLLDELLDGVKRALSENLLGFYLRGSLALGDFDPMTSDIDILVVTHRPVSSSEFDALSRMHSEVAVSDTRYANHLEVSYIDRAAIKRFAPGERYHPTVGADWPFGWAEHRANWILERWIVRERGVTLLGPDPKTLIDPIPPEELCAAVRDELRARLRDWAGGTSIPDWLLPRYYQAFEVETVCRALYTVARGELPTKARAVAWALEQLPEPWRSLVEQSQEWRSDSAEDASRVPEVKAFVRWAASEVGAGT
jgi:predicted nucleotidyltransferase